MSFEELNIIRWHSHELDSVPKCAKKKCGSVVEFSLVLFSIFGLFFTFNHLFFVGGGEVGKKRAVMDNVMTVNLVSL